MKWREFSVWIMALLLWSFILSLITIEMHEKNLVRAGWVPPPQKRVYQRTTVFLLCWYVGVEQESGTAQVQPNGDLWLSQPNPQGLGEVWRFFSARDETLASLLAKVNQTDDWRCRETPPNECGSECLRVDVRK